MNPEKREARRVASDALVVAAERVIDPPTRTEIRTLAVVLLAQARTGLWVPEDCHLQEAASALFPEGRS